MFNMVNNLASILLGQGAANKVVKNAPPKVKEGLILMFIGMAGVFLVLLAIFLLVKLLTFIDSKVSKSAKKASTSTVGATIKTSNEDIQLKAAISAALHHHKRKRN